MLTGTLSVFTKYTSNTTTLTGTGKKEHYANLNKWIAALLPTFAYNCKKHTFPIGRNIHTCHSYLKVTGFVCLVKLFH